MRDLNKLHKIVQENFNSRQHYISPNGHPMPIHLETVGDESPIDDFENRRFYVQLFEMKLLGYLLDEDKFEIVPTVNRALIVSELVSTPILPRVKLKADKVTSNINYTFVFKPKSVTDITLTAEYDSKFTELVNQVNISNIDIKVNGVAVSIPFVVTAGDTILIDITKNIFNTGSFSLRGNLI